MSQLINPWLKQLHQNLGVSYADIPYYKKWVNLATTTHTNQPRCRTIVFRGFTNNNTNKGVMKFGTDIRTDKIKEIEFQPMVEICWYFAATMEQFRIRGLIEVCKLDDELTHSQKVDRVTMWNEFNKYIKSGFFGPQPGDATSSTFNPEFTPNLDDSENFCVLYLKPQQVDWLNLKSPPFQRILYTLDNETSTWIETPINP